jgi:RNA 2',3'-cyclic 3'-phosphodiesterase
VPRLFLGFSLPDDTRLALAKLANGLPIARWVAAEQLHVTIRFLGRIGEEEVQRVHEQVSEVKTSAFAAAIQGVGCFPAAPAHEAGVLWAGLAPHEPIVALKQVIDSQLGPDPETRAFTPHVTLARWKAPMARELAGFLEENRTLATAPFVVTAFHLFESRPGGSGSLYQILRSYALPRRS